MSLFSSPNSKYCKKKCWTHFLKWWKPYPTPTIRRLGKKIVTPTGSPFDSACGYAPVQSPPLIATGDPPRSFYFQHEAASRIFTTLGLDPGGETWSIATRSILNLACKWSQWANGNISIMLNAQLHKYICIIHWSIILMLPKSQKCHICHYFRRILPKAGNPTIRMPGSKGSGALPSQSLGGVVPLTFGKKRGGSPADVGLVLYYNMP